MNKAAIDIGSNTVQFLLIDENDKQQERRQFVTSLGRDLDKTEKFHDESMISTLRALEECVKVCNKYSILPEDIMVTATEASRVARNANQFYFDLKKKLGLNFNIIDSSKEAYFSSKGFLFGEKPEAGREVLIDIGGASTELILIEKKPYKVISTISLPIGSVRMKSWFEEKKLNEQLDKVFGDRDFSEYKTSSIVALAGTATSLMGIKLGLHTFDEVLIDKNTMSAEELKTMKEMIQKLGVEKLKKEYPFLEKRADVIYYGACIMDEFQKRLGFDMMTVSTKSLVHGSIQGSTEV